MKFNDLDNNSVKTKRRVGRGIASGRGKTAGRGTKGQNSRSGSSKKPGFDGGQNPLMQRMPKLRGFKSHKTPVDVIYTGQLDNFGAVIDNSTLADAGLVETAHTKIKVINSGSVDKKHTVKLQFASDGAVKAIQKAGGQFTSTQQIGRVGKDKKSNKA